MIRSWKPSNRLPRSSSRTAMRFSNVRDWRGHADRRRSAMRFSAILAAIEVANLLALNALHIHRSAIGMALDHGWPSRTPVAAFDLSRAAPSLEHRKALRWAALDRADPPSDARRCASASRRRLAVHAAPACAGRRHGLPREMALPPPPPRGARWTCMRGRRREPERCHRPHAEPARRDRRYFRHHARPAWRSPASRSPKRRHRRLETAWSLQILLPLAVPTGRAAARSTAGRTGQPFWRTGVNLRFPYCSDS